MCFQILWYRSHFLTLIRADPQQTQRHAQRAGQGWELEEGCSGTPPTELTCLENLLSRADLVSPGLCVISTVSLEYNNYTLPSIVPQVLNVCPKMQNNCRFKRATKNIEWMPPIYAFPSINFFPRIDGFPFIDVFPFQDVFPFKMSHLRFSL